MGSFRIGNYNVDVLARVEQKRDEYPLCDEIGNPVTSERSSGKTTYKNKDGVIISKTYKLINGKPYDKFKKTDAVNVYEEVSKTEMYDLISECCYLCKNEKLKDYLQENDKALKFIYTNGGGYKAYIGYLAVYQNRLVMYLGFGSIIEQIKAIESNRVEEVQEEVVARGQPEELMLNALKVK